MLKEIIKPTRIKILLDLIIAILYLIIIFSVPAWSYREKFANLTFIQFILSICLSLILAAVIYYPFACGLLGIYRSIIKSFNYRYFLASAIIVLIFNPLSYHLISVPFINNNQPLIRSGQMETCDLAVVSFTEFSKAESSGLIVGDIVTSVDGLKITGVNDIIRNSEGKDPGDTTDLGTNRGIFKVELVGNPGKNNAVLGIKFNDINCRRDINISQPANPDIDSDKQTGICAY